MSYYLTWVGVIPRGSKRRSKDETVGKDCIQRMSIAIFCTLHSSIIIIRKYNYANHFTCAIVRREYEKRA